MKKIKNKIGYQLPILFLGVLFLPLLNSLLGIWKFDRKDENRNFKNEINFSKYNLKNIPTECESYWNDNFSFRSPLLDAYHYLKYYYFNISPYPDKTIIGSDGWFFITSKELEVYQGKHDFPENTLQDFKEELLNRKNFLDSMNIKMYWIVAPFKHHIYSEELPMNIFPGPKRRIVQLMESFGSDLNNCIIDPVPQMRELKDSTKLFYKLDNHWNLKSGQITTELLLSKIKKDFPDKEFPEFPEYKWRDTISQIGFHRTVMGIDELSEVRQLPIIDQQASIEDEKYGFPNVPGFPYPSEYEKRFTNANLDNGLRVLFIRDSFGEQMMPFIRDQFSETVFIFDAWQYKLNKAIVEELKPDIVIFEGLETNIEAFMTFSEFK